MTLKPASSAAYPKEATPLFDQLILVYIGGKRVPLLNTITASLRGMSWDDWKNASAVFQSFVTGIGIVLGGIWAYRRYVLQQESNSYIEFSADLNFIGKQTKWWIVEIVGFIENKGKVQHRMQEFEFELDAIYPEDQAVLDPRWGNQVNFGHSVARGSFLPQSSKFFFIAPTVKASYSHVTLVPEEARFLILHCRFNYPNTLLDRIRNLIPKYRTTRGHVAEKTARVPDGESCIAKPPAKDRCPDDGK